MTKSSTDRVFLSYAKENINIVKDVYEGLKKRGLNVWFDKEDLKIGYWKTQIEKAISRSRYFIICISEAALRKIGDETPGFQDEELNTAYKIAEKQSDKNFSIVPVRLEDCSRGDSRLSCFQQYDLFKDFEKHLDKLAIQLGGFALSDSTAKDERNEEEKTFENIMGKAEVAKFAAEYDKAIEYYQKALEFDLNSFGKDYTPQFDSIYIQIGDSSYMRSLQYYNKALEVAKKDGDSMRCVPHLSGIANCWMKLGDFDAAQQAYEYALQIVENSGDLYRKAEVFGNIGSLAYIIRDYKSALGWYDKAQKTSNLCGDVEQEGLHTMNLANVYVKSKQYDNAFDCYSKARKILKGVWTKHPNLQMLDKHEQQAKRLFEKDQQSSAKE